MHTPVDLLDVSDHSHLNRTATTFETTPLTISTKQQKITQTNVKI